MRWIEINFVWCRFEINRFKGRSKENFVIRVRKKNRRKITFPEIQNCQVKDFPTSSVLNELSGNKA